MKINSCLSSDGKKKNGILFGVLLVVSGVLFLSFNFGWIDTALKRVIFSWPMIFIVIGFFKIFGSNKTGSFLFLLFGGFFLISRIAAVYPGSIPGVEGDFARAYWPLLLIIIGLVFILKMVLVKQRKRRVLPFHGVDPSDERFTASETARQTGDGINIKAVFEGSESICLDAVFKGGEISVVFGGVVLDLRRTQLPEGVTCLNIDAVFGGVELKIPGDWPVEPRFRTIMGGVEDKRLFSSSDNKSKLILQGDLVFGGCEIH